jgi:hypothetical protein
LLRCPAEAMRALDTRHFWTGLYKDKSMAFLAWDGLLHVNDKRAFYGRRISRAVILLFSLFSFSLLLSQLYIDLASTIRIELNVLPRVTFSLSKR